MKLFGRLLMAGAIVALATGPALAAPLAVSAGPSVQAPASHAERAPSPLRWLLYGLGAFGAIKVKDTGSLAKKFVRNASNAAGDYKTGVEGSGQDWATNTAAAEGNYEQGVTASIADKRFGKGVAKAGAAKFTQRASVLGAQRYPTGVGAAEADWARETQPFLDVIKNVQLPPRRPKGDPGNQARANAVAQALRAAKVGR